MFSVAIGFLLKSVVTRNCRTLLLRGSLAKTSRDFDAAQSDPRQNCKSSAAHACAARRQVLI
jgi:hypothetical protein